MTFKLLIVNSDFLSCTKDFYNNFIKGKAVNFAIIGNTKKFDVKALEKHGTVKKLKKKDILKEL